MGPQLSQAEYLRRYTQAMTEISRTGTAKTISTADYRLARGKWIDAARTSSKLGKGLGWLSVFVGSAGLSDLVIYGNGDASGVTSDDWHAVTPW